MKRIIKQVWPVLVVAMIFVFAATPAVHTYFYDLVKNNVLVKTHLDVTGEADIKNLKFTPDVTYVDSISDLSTFSGAASGTSYIWLEWGKHYIVDLYAIAHSTAGTATNTTAFGAASLTMVSGVMRQPTTADAEKTITVELAATKVTGYHTWSGGGTVFAVWAPLNSAATIYGGEGGVGLSGATCSPLLVTYTTLGSVSTYKITNITTGGSDWELNRPGETKTWRASVTSDVSAYPVAKHVFN